MTWAKMVSSTRFYGFLKSGWMDNGYENIMFLKDERMNGQKLCFKNIYFNKSSHYLPQKFLWWYDQANKTTFLQILHCNKLSIPNSITLCYCTVLPYRSQFISINIQNNLRNFSISAHLHCWSSWSKYDITTKQHLYFIIISFNLDDKL